MLDNASKIISKNNPVISHMQYCNTHYTGFIRNLCKNVNKPLLCIRQLNRRQFNVYVIFGAKMPRNCWFKPLRCEDFLFLKS